MQQMEIEALLSNQILAEFEMTQPVSEV